MFWPFMKPSFDRAFRRGLSGQDCRADCFGDIGYDGVAQRRQPGTAVQPAGKPINHSTQSGFSRPPTASGKGQARRRVRWVGIPAFQSRALGVGQNEDAGAAVGRAGMGSTHHERPAGVARCFQAAEHPVRAANAECRDILNDKPKPGGTPARGRACAAHSPLRAPSSPAPGPAVLMSWQGKPPQMRCGAGMASVCSCRADRVRMSP